MTERSYRQLEIWWVDLEPTKRDETRKNCPCVIVQSDPVNARSRTLLVGPLLPDHKDWPFAVNIKPSEQNGLDKDRHLNLKQIRAVDVMRFSNKQGVLERSYLGPVHAALRMVFGMD